MLKIATEVRAQLRLLLPILAASIAQNLMGLVDTVMAGSVSKTDLAAVAVANSFWFPLVLVLYGTMMSVTSVISYFLGSGRKKRVISVLWQAIYLSLILALILILLQPFLYFLLDIFVDNLRLKNLSIGYLKAIVLCAPALGVYFSIRAFFEGMNDTKPIMFISFLGLLANIPLNYIFIYGKLGLPKLGGVGCGYATAIVVWIMAIFMVIYINSHKKYKLFSFLKKIQKPKLNQIKSLAKLGLPNAGGLFFESTQFALVAVLLVPFGVTQVASHQISINVSSILFMIPFSIGCATAIRVATVYGAKDLIKIKQVTRTSLKMGLFIAAISAFFIILFRYGIADLYINEIEVIKLSGSILIFAGLYQFFDATQTIICGALRGLKDTLAIFLITLFSYWGVGLTSGYILSSTDLIVQPMLAKGYWVGFILGLTSAALLFSLRFRYILNKQSQNF